MKSKQKQIEKILRKIDNSKIYYLKAKNIEDLNTEMVFLHRKDRFLVVNKSQISWLRRDDSYFESLNPWAYGHDKEADELGLFCVGKYGDVKLWMEK